MYRKGLYVISTSSALSSVPIQHADFELSNVIRSSVDLLEREYVQTQHELDDVVVDRGLEAKVFGGFRVEVVDAPVAAFAGVKDTKGTGNTRNEKNKTGNSSEQTSFVAVNSSEGGNKKYQCHPCDERFPGRSGRHWHAEKIHAMHGAQCNDCGELFQRKRNVPEHHKGKTFEKQDAVL